MDVSPVRVLIAGGGVAAIEASLTLKELLGARAAVTLLAPEPEFVYRPLAVAEPFGLASAAHIALPQLAREAGAQLHPGKLDRVAPEHDVAITEDGEELEYDALMLTLGARPSPALAGAMTYRGVRDNAAYGSLLQEFEHGELRRLVFAVPTAVHWSLPLYELALLTAWHARRKQLKGVKLALITHEEKPLGLFGARASESVRRLIADAGIELQTSAAPAAVDGDELLLMNGGHIEADGVVALPRLEVDPIAGVPQGPHGFFGTDLNMRVEGRRNIYAAGDATWFPIKQGGIATQQADTAASAIAAEEDPAIAIEPFRPVLRATVLAGDKAWSLNATIDDPDGTSASGIPQLFSPTGKIVGRRLLPFLASRVDRPWQGPVGSEVKSGTQDGDEEEVDLVEMALTAADADARWGDHHSALRWLEIAERLGHALSPAQQAKRSDWMEKREEGA
jgi:sulfide:quinone oxidoreductase